MDEPTADLEVPGEPFDFGTLIRAQADGDLQTLRDHGLDAVRVRWTPGTSRGHRRHQGGL